MTIDRQELRWNGWGWVNAPDTLGEKADAVWAWIGDTLGVAPLPSTPAKNLSAIAVSSSGLDAASIEQLKQLLGAGRVKSDDYERVFHARGRSYHDLLYLRAGQLDSVPDAVIYPISAEECLAVVRFAAEENLAVIPFGGGSTVVGGVTALAGPGQKGVITLDTTLMDSVLVIDAVSRVARVQAGIYGPHLEESLQAKGYTLGHYPQSFEFSTLGGWIAPRGAGHQSNRYGSAAEWFVSAQVATPTGLWNSENFPGSAAGPQLSDLIVGSEGVLGVITEATVKIHPVPEAMDYRAYVFPAFEGGVAATREMMQSGVPTAMIRLSDHAETFFYNALDTGGAGADAPSQFCLMLVGLEGESAAVEAARERSAAIVEKNGGMHMGESPAKNWYASRFATPYLRDPMMDRGLGVDTLETCTTWPNLVHVHDAVTQAITEAMAANPGLPGARGIVMSHVSHAYPSGASLYFTFAFVRDSDRAIEQWWAIKRAASDTIATHGGTISHHHGVGTDHLPWIGREKGPIGSAILRSVKKTVDPNGVMNPGKLIV